MTNKILQLFNSKNKYGLLLSNISWQAFERGSRMIFGAITGIMVAAYLGPSLLGIYSYAVSFMMLFSPLTNMGYNVLLPRDIVFEKDKWHEILGSSAFLRIIGSLSAICLIWIYLYFNVTETGESKLIIRILSLSFLFYPFEIFDIWFRAKMVSKFASIGKTTAMVIINGLKILLIYEKATLEMFAWLYVSEFVIDASLQLYFYLKTERGNITKWIVRQKRIKFVLLETWPLFISLFSYMIYSRIDQIMIGNMLDKEKVGIFAAAEKISDLPITMLLVLNGALYPFLAEKFKNNKTDFNQKYLMLTEGYTILSYFLYLLIVPLSGWIIHIYPASFASGQSLLQINFIGVIIIFNAGLRNSYLSFTGKQKYILHTTLISAILNIGINFYAIPAFGIKGAAYASVFSEFMSLFLLNITIPALRPVFSVQAKGLLPITLFRFILKRSSD